MKDLKGERARLGRSEPRPRGSHLRLEKDQTFGDFARSCSARGAPNGSRGGCAPRQNGTPVVCHTEANQRLNYGNISRALKSHRRRLVGELMRSL
jgi:hypothetical protein